MRLSPAFLSAEVSFLDPPAPAPASDEVRLKADTTYEREGCADGRTGAV
jgi:hypothetical protein